MTRPHKRTLVQLTSAIAVGTMLTVGAGAAAMAAPANQVDASKQGELIIHKYMTPSTPTNLPNDGTELSAAQTADLTPLAGADYSIQRVDPSTYDLTTNSGWTNLEGLTPANAAGKPHDTPLTGTTNANGVIDFTSLPLGVYLVTETKSPDNVSALSAPFLVTIPLTNPDDTSSWLYTVNVYPKNDVTAVTKTVDDTNSYAIGDPMTWTITADIPKAETIDGYKIVDPINGHLTFTSASVTLSDGTPLVKDTDYTLSYTATDPTLAGQLGIDAADYPSSVVVEFTDAGRAKLAQHNQAQVIVAVNTTINSTGDVSNMAVLYPNTPSFDIKPGDNGGPIITPPVTSKFGNLTLHKVDANDNTKSLAGAQFQVYASESDAKNGTNPLSVNGQSTFTTGSDGIVTISGLRYSGWANGGAVQPGNSAYEAYWIAETKAPSGYSLLAEPIETVVDSQDTTVDYNIEDVLANGSFQLPFTGSVVSASLFYGAGAIVLAGVVLMVIRSRRKAAEES